MRSVTIPQHGSADVLTYVTDFPEPRPGPGEVLVRVHATGVNQIDRVVRMGYPGVTLPLPHICGGDITGVITAHGPDTEAPPVGTRVVVYPLLPCYDCPLCAEGRLNLCQRWRYFGLHVNGGYAEYVAVPSYNLVPLPDSVAFTDAVTLPVAGLTALHALKTVGQLQPGQTFFIWGGSGALGMIAIQLAKNIGATVIATGSSMERLDAMRAVGADHVINRRTEDVPARVMELCAAGVDLALDYVGPETFNTTLTLLKKGGTVLLCGILTGRETTFNIHAAYMKHISIKGLYLGQKDELEALVESLAAGRIRPIIDSVLPLADAQLAHRKLESGDYCGKIVLAVV